MEDTLYYLLYNTLYILFIERDSQLMTVLSSKEKKRTKDKTKQLNLPAVEKYRRNICTSLVRPPSVSFSTTRGARAHDCALPVILWACDNTSELILYGSVDRATWCQPICLKGWNRTREDQKSLGNTDTTDLGSGYRVSA